ncbi:LLM class F420-dependent oxidoreductase [Haliea atlantica]|jgi:probable F420-dependent oxidoreductase|nr:LLM class F420-dependent oxidoreductase [Haliea sp.]|tara:strand:+ start:11944 stop:12804 length:861 start_codon:yes stop_codon:yes gene_type:complete
MHIGFSFMNTPLDPDPRELATALEDRGFESLWTGEHSHIPRCRTSPYPAGGELPEPYKQMGDPYVTLMAAAAVTTRLKLGTGIALLMERELFSQAKTIASLDRLSGGRLMIGTGVGWNEEEFTNTTHQPWKKRYGVMRETVAASRALWRDEAPEYHGEYINFDPVWFAPKPAQVEGPPVIFGAMGPLGVRHAAEWADGWMPVDVAMGDVAEGIRGFREQVAGNGRDPDRVPITLQTLMTPDLDTLKRYRDLGVERIVVGVALDMWDQPEKIMPMVDEFGELIQKLG